MIAAGVDSGSVEGLAAGDVETVVELLDFCAHGAEVGGDQRDAVGFFDAQFFRVANADAVLREGADGGEDGQLVDELRGERAGDGGAGEAVGRRVDLDGANELVIFGFEVEDADVGAERGEDVEERGAGGVEAEVVEDEVRAREESGGAQEEGGGGDVAGDGGFDGVELLAPGDGDGVFGAVDGGAEGTKGELAVIAGADGFVDGGGATGLESGKEDCSFDLGAGDRCGVVDGGERRAVDDDGGVAVGEFELCAHLRQRLADALHGAAAERFVAGEGKGSGRVGDLGGEEAGEHADGGAGVAAVEGLARGAEVARGTGDFYGAAVARHLCTEGGDAGEGGCAVGSGREIGEARGAFGESAE